MRILFIANADSVHSLRWVEYFAGAGHEVSLVSFGSEQPSFKNANISFYPLSAAAPGPLAVFELLLKTRRIISRVRPDIIHAHYIGMNGLVAAISGFSPLVLTAWGSDIIFGGRHFLKRLFVKYCMSRAALITCDAEHMINAMKGLGADSRKLRIINFGIDTKRFSPGSSDPQVRAGFSIPEGSPVIISLRNFHPVYDIETLVRAVPLILRDEPKAFFVIAGTGPEEGKLKALVDSLGVGSAVRFIGRYQSSTLPSYLRTAALYVSTSLSDAGISASTAEAMACGTPVLISDTGENSKWVEHGANGMIFKASDHEDLARKAVLMLRDPEHARRLGLAGRATIIERNDYYVEMEKMDGLYRAVLDSHSRAKCG